MIRDLPTGTPKTRTLKAQRYQDEGVDGILLIEREAVGSQIGPRRTRTVWNEQRVILSIDELRKLARKYLYEMGGTSE